MLKLVESTEAAGLVALMGQRVTVFCSNYIYTGKLTGVNDTYVQLSDAAIVYETGSLMEKGWKDAQPLPHDLFIMVHAIESFMILK